MSIGFTYIIAGTHLAAMQFCQQHQLNPRGPYTRIILRAQDLKGCRFRPEDRVAFVYPQQIPYEVYQEFHYLEAVSAKPKRMN